MVFRAMGSANCLQLRALVEAAEHGRWRTWQADECSMTDLICRDVHVQILQNFIDKTINPRAKRKRERQISSEKILNPSDDPPVLFHHFCGRSSSLWALRQEIQKFVAGMAMAVAMAGGRAPSLQLATEFLGVKFNSEDFASGSTFLRVTGNGSGAAVKDDSRGGMRVFAMAKKGSKKAGGGSSGGAAQKERSSGSRGGGAGVAEKGTPYENETRRIILSLRNIRRVTPMGKEILKNINVGMYLGAKIGLLGPNGAGKSSLIKILGGVDKGFDGDYYLDPNMKVGYLPQEPELNDGETVMSNIEPALASTRQLLADFEQVSLDMADPNADMDKLMNKMERLQNALDACNGWELERQLENALNALRCPPGEALVKNLSGGERRRVALARLLLQTPDILLLDEPTNHLDAESVAWLERYLAEFKGTVVAITHDRYFLDNVAGWILELDRGQGIPFEGNYSAWLEAKAKRLEVEEKQQSALQRTMARELEWIRQNAKGQQKKGKARERAYDELVRKAGEYQKSEKLESMFFPQGPRLGNLVVEAQALQKGFNGRLLVDGLSFSLPPGGVVGIIGGNGAGKTTLFRMIMGQDTPDGGYLRVGDTVVPLYVDQSRDSLAGDKTVFEEITDGFEEISLGERKVNARAYCNWFNFRSADQQKKVSNLSGGERNRLQLAKVMKKGGNLLLLDEPTNDLDVDTLRALEDAIINFAGCAVIISHDRWFLDRIATHILAFEGESQVTWFEGSYSEYEADRRMRLGDKEPTRLKYHAIA